MAEKKYGDSGFILSPNTTLVPLPSLPVSYSGSIGNCTAVVLGTSDQNRIGDKVTGTSLEVNYSVYAPDAAIIAGYVPENNYWFRIIFFIWKDDTTPTPGDITDQSLLLVGNIYTPMAPLNHDRKVKRKILYDKTHHLFTSTSTSNTTVACFNPQVTRRFSINLTKLRGGLNIINYQNNTTTGVNNIYLLLYSNIAPAATALTGWEAQIWTRYNFIDM